MTDGAEAAYDARSGEIRASVRVAAGPQAVWRAWAEPGELARWFVDEARGEARRGETMTWVWRAFGVEVPYEVRAADAPGRLVLSTPAGAAPAGLIEITIARDGGETVLTVVNSGFLDAGVAEPVVEGMRSGWSMALALLKEYLERYRGRDKQTFQHFRPARFDLHAILPWFTDERLLARWLTRAGAPAPVGQRTGLTLHDGAALEVRTLARTDYEVMLGVEELSAVLELKAFGTGAGERFLGVRGTSWAGGGELENLAASLDASVSRLAAAVGEPHPTPRAR